MMEGLAHLFSRRSFHEVLIDILDIIIVTYVVYRALLVLRGTRAMQMGTGLAVIGVVYVAANWLGLVTLINLLSYLLSSIILIVVVVFQNDIRRGLMRVGARAFFAGLSRQQESRVIDEVVAAATELARHRMGALICFEQDANLDEFVVAQGTVLDASVQRELLVALFVPDGTNKLHDGAVIIRNLRIAKAGTFFPMPDTRVLDKSLGSRHRAALGITEETDAVVVVVSEERGTISFCFNGNIVSNLDGASLRQALLGLFGQGARKRKTKKNTVSQSGTGSYRVSIVPASTPSPPSTAPTSSKGDSKRDSVPPPSAAPTPIVLTPILPRSETLGGAKEAPAARPMAPARPIETPSAPPPPPLESKVREG